MILALGAMVGLSAAPAQASLGWSQTAHPIVSKCLNGLTWRGGSAWGYYQVTGNVGVDSSYLSDLPHGTMDVCYFTYYGDKTSDGDYYLAEVQATIRTSSSTYHKDFPATTAMWAISDVSPKDGVRAWTPGKVSSKSCGQSITVTASFGVLSASTGLQGLHTTASS